MKSKITKRVVDAADAGKRDKFIWDTDTKGFGLKVTPAGNHIYVLQSRVGGKIRRYTIGKHGSPWTPDMARDEAIRLLGQIVDGKDPGKAKAEGAGDMTIAELCDRYMTAAERGEVLTRFGQPKKTGTCVDAPLNASIFFEQIKACGQVQSCVRPHNAALYLPRARMEIRGSGPNRLRALEGASSGHWFS